MEPSEVLLSRLAVQHLTSSPSPRAAEAVRRLTCVQSQERDHAFWSLGLRSRASTYAAVRAEHDSGAFVRTHILRSTWHFVAPEDLRWIQSLTAPRVEQSIGTYLRRDSIDEPLIARTFRVLAGCLAGQNVLTRNEIAARFQVAGLPAKGLAFTHLIMLAELRALVCGGPMAGVHHTYGLVDELIPPSRERPREEALVELAHRFFGGHGPACLKDFTRWSSLTVADARTALTELEADGRLQRGEVSGIPHWSDAAVAERTTRPRVGLLLPEYDEVTLSYPQVNFPVAHDLPTNESDPWWTTVLVDGTRVGSWKRTLARDRVTVAMRLSPSVTADQSAAIDEGVERLGRFLGLVVDRVGG